MFCLLFRCEAIPPAVLNLKVIPQCVGCEVPTPSATCPKCCLFVPVSIAALLPVGRCRLPVSKPMLKAPHGISA